MTPQLIRYIVRRLLLMIPTLFGVSIVAFGLMHLAPGSAASAMLGERATPEALAALEREMRLDQPLYQQYLHWVSRVVRGDLGESFVTHKSVMELLGERMLVTLEIGLLSLVIALAGAIPLGVLAAVHQDRLRDHTARIIALLGISIPDFWSGILLILVFGVSLGWGSGWRIHAAVGRRVRELALGGVTRAYARIRQHGTHYPDAPVEHGRNAEPELRLDRAGDGRLRPRRCLG